MKGRRGQFWVDAIASGVLLLVCLFMFFSDQFTINPMFGFQLFVIVFSCFWIPFRLNPIAIKLGERTLREELSLTQLDTVAWVKQNFRHPTYASLSPLFSGLLASCWFAFYDPYRGFFMLFPILAFYLFITFVFTVPMYFQTVKWLWDGKPLWNTWAFLVLLSSNVVLIAFCIFFAWISDGIAVSTFLIIYILLFLRQFYPLQFNRVWQDLGRHYFPSDL